jgi:hypothetical protein
MSETMTDEVMARDVFPAEVYEVGKGTMTKVRAFVTSHRLIVYGLGDDNLPELRIDVDLAEDSTVFESRAVMGHAERLEVATLTRGFIINKGLGCGCAGPLKALKALPPPVAWRKR